MYIILFGKLKLEDENKNQIGTYLNIGWTVGEEILFKNTKKPGLKMIRNDNCSAVTESCVLGLEKRNLA